MDDRQIVVWDDETLFLPVGADQLVRWIIPGGPEDDPLELLTWLRNRDPRARTRVNGWFNLARVIAGYDDPLDSHLELYLDGGVKIAIHQSLRDKFITALEGRSSLETWKD